MAEQMIYSKIRELPVDMKKEVNDFVDFLLAKRRNNNSQAKKQRIFGYAKGSIVIKSNFDEPLEDFKEYMQ